MTLPKQVLTIPIDGGIDGGKHEYQLVPPGNAVVLNGRYLQDGAVAKRFGFSLLPTLSGTTGSWTEEGGLHTVIEQDGRIVAIGHDGTVAHNEVKNSWNTAGSLAPRPSQAKTDPFLRGNNNMRHADMAISTVAGKKVSCTVWQDSEDQLVYYAFHEVPSDGRPPVILSGPTPLGGDLTTFPKVACSADGWFMIAGTDTIPAFKVYTAYCDASSSYSFTTSAAYSAIALADGITAGSIEILSNNETGTNQAFWVVSNRTVTTAIYKLKRDGSVDANRTVAKGGCLTACLITTPSTQKVMVVHSDGNISHLDSDLATAETTTLILTPSATAGAVNAATATQTTVGGSSVIAWSGDAVSGAPVLFPTAVDVARVTSGFALNSSMTLPMVRLGGEACWDGTEAGPMIPLVNHFSANTQALLPFQCGYVGKITDTLSGDWYVAHVASYGLDVAHMLEGYYQPVGQRTIGSLAAHLPSMVSTAGGRYVMPYTVFTDKIDPLDVTSGIDVLRLETVGSGPLRSVSAAGLSLYQGGFGVAGNDGAVSAELTPMPLVQCDDTIDTTKTYSYGVTSPSSGVGSPAPQLFLKYAYRWRDEKGNLHRGLPSGEFTHDWWALDTGTYYARFMTFQRPWPMAVNGEIGGLNYEVEVYQADASGGDYYFLGTATPVPWPAGNGTQDYIVLCMPPVYDALNKSMLLVRAIPSTSGLVPLWTGLGELLNVPPPSFVDICSTQDRIWGLSGEKGRLEVWPSKAIATGIAPEFSPSLVIGVPAEGGECTGIATLDDKVVLFKERAIFVIFGEPGNNNGARSTLQPPRLVSSDVGCSNANSIVQGPFGIAFQASSTSASGRAGIHVIDKGLSLSFSGSPAKEIAAGVSFKSASLLDREKEVRWVVGDGTLLVWSYDVNRWHLHTGRGSGSSCTRRGSYAIARDANIISVDSDVFDSKDEHEMSLVTAWIKPVGLQRFWRVWTASFLLGDYYSGGVTIGVQQDYSNTYTQTVSFTAAEIAAMERKQLIVDIKQQKCESIRFVILENATGNGSPGQGFELVSLEIEAGLKQGSYRRWLPVSNRRG